MRGVRTVLCLGALLALVACDSDRPAPESKPPAAPAVQPAAEPESAAPPAPSEPAVAPPPAAPEPQSTPQVIAQPPAQPRPAAPASPPAAPKPAVPSQPVAPVTPQPEPVPVAVERPLDLSLPGALDEVFPLPDAALAVPAAGEETPGGLLPPLFKAEEDKQSSFELGGRLITTEHPEEDGEGYWDSVEGAELQLHFRR